MNPINVLFILATVLMFLSACVTPGEQKHTTPDWQWTSATAYKVTE